MARACPSASAAPERGGAAEARRPAAAGRGREVRELAGVRVGGLRRDRLDGAVAAHLDDRRATLPGVVEEQRALVTHGLELVAGGDDEAAVELADDVVGEAQDARERDVD